MLAAAAEHEPGEPELLALALESQRMWPEFGRALEAASGIGIDFRESGILVVALARDEVERLRFRYDLHRRCELATQWLGGAQVRDLEPGLRPSVAAGLYCPDDHQVDPRRVMAALRAAALASGVRLYEHCAVEALDLTGGRVSGVETAAGRCRAGTVVLAAGAWTAGKLLPAGLSVPVRPLKGQALALTATADTGTLSHIVWTEQVHMAAKGDGRLIVGSTVEERGFDTGITAGGVYAAARRRAARLSGDRGDGGRDDLGRVAAELDRRRADPRRHRDRRSCRRHRAPPQRLPAGAGDGGGDRSAGGGRGGAADGAPLRARPLFARSEPRARIGTSGKRAMKLTVNGNARECQATNLADLWREETAALEIAEPRGFAISLNGEVVRRAAWPATPVRDGDAVEIIRAMSGG